MGLRVEILGLSVEGSEFRMKGSGLHLQVLDVLWAVTFLSLSLSLYLSISLSLSIDLPLARSLSLREVKGWECEGYLTNAGKLDVFRAVFPWFMV